MEALMSIEQIKYNSAEQQQLYEDINYRIGLRIKKLEEDAQWKESIQIRPAFISPENMGIFQKMIENAVPFLSYQQLSTIRANFEHLSIINRERSKVFVERTRIGADLYDQPNSHQLKSSLKRFLFRQPELQIINVFAVSLTQNQWVETKQWVSFNGASNYKQIGMLDAQVGCMTRAGCRLINIKMYREKLPKSNRNKYQFAIVCVDEALAENLINN